MLYCYYTCLRLGLLTSKQVKVVGIEQLEAEQGKNNFKRERTPIYKVSIKQLNYVVKIYEAHLEINQTNKVTQGYIWVGF